MSQLAKTNKDNPEAVQAYYFDTVHHGLSKRASYREHINPDISDIGNAIARLERGELYVAVQEEATKAMSASIAAKAKQITAESQELYRKGIKTVNSMLDEAESNGESSKALSEMRKVLEIPGVIADNRGAAPHQNFDMEGIVQ